jgi:hypothetical protein
MYTLSSGNEGTGTYLGELAADGVPLLAIRADGRNEPEGFLPGILEIPDFPEGTRVGFTYDVVWQHFENAGEQFCTTRKQLTALERLPELLPEAESSKALILIK